MTALPAYNQDAMCEKCGSQDVSSVYEAGCGEIRGCDRHPERICRTCQRCHFQWGEAPLTARAAS